MKPEQRAWLLVQFSDPKTDVRLFMPSTRAGGLGLGWQSADSVIVYIDLTLLTLVDAGSCNLEFSR